jgi:hypothetical protein
MDGPLGLRDALLKHQDMVLRNLTENLMTYALGRRLEYQDMPAVRSIVSSAGKKDNKFSAYVVGIVTHPSFRMSEAGPLEGAARATAAQQQQ